jgi:hypothetical protein
MAGKTKDVPQNEIETAIDEALEQVRPKRR